MISNSANTAALRELDATHYLHPFTDHKALRSEGSRVITRAEGVWLYDSEGEAILDGMSGLWCVNLGYGRVELADAAHRQMLELPYYNSFFKTAHPPAIELAKVLAEITPRSLNQVFFTSSGSEANDTVVRLVRRYWQLKGQPDRQVIISRWGAYHGSTIAGASLGGMKPMHAQGGLAITGVEHIDQPFWFHEGGDLDPAAFGVAVARRLEDKIKALGADSVAAFIAEPVQGAGGVIVPPASYWPEIRRICREYGVLLVVDEVICGFGRTGEWFGCDYYGIEEVDLMPFAKGVTSGYLPLGGVMVSDRVADVVVERGGEFYHGFTYSGHPAACAVALENIRILRDEDIIQRVHDDTAPYLQARLGELADHPLVGEVRGLGMLGAIELVPDKPSRRRFDEPGKAGDLCRDYCFTNGLVMRAVGDSMLTCPPLTISHAEIDTLIERAVKCLDLTAADLGIS